MKLGVTVCITSPNGLLSRMRLWYYHGDKYRGIAIRFRHNPAFQKRTILTPVEYTKDIKHGDARTKHQKFCWESESRFILTDFTSANSSVSLSELGLEIEAVIFFNRAKAQPNFQKLVNLCQKNSIRMENKWIPWCRME